MNTLFFLLPLSLFYLVTNLNVITNLLVTTIFLLVNIDNFETSILKKNKNETSTSYYL
ncbi:protein of unknown function [Chryseobacterium sp. JV274]|nr:protein of unknown function [Chryseobacterium sp. JV274]